MVQDYGLLNVLEQARAELRATSLDVTVFGASIALSALWQEGDSTVGVMRYTVNKGARAVIAEEVFSRMTMAPNGTRLVTAQ